MYVKLKRGKNVGAVAFACTGGARFVAGGGTAEHRDIQTLSRSTLMRPRIDGGKARTVG